MSIATPILKHTETHRSSELAINGGPKAVTAKSLDRWKSVHLTDAIPILKSIYRRKTTAVRGGDIARFEREFAKMTGSKYAIAMNSGTATLHSALFAVGVGPGDEVIVPSYTWHASATAALCCGAQPVFCDIDPRTLTVDPEDVCNRITDRTKAIMPVHVWGNPAEMDVLTDIAKQHQIAIVEDCSHAHGAIYAGKSVGAWGDVGCFSLQGQKAVSGGEGGVAVCNDAALYDRMLALGQPVRVKHDLQEDNFHLGMMNAGPKYRPHLFGVLLASRSLKRLPKLNRLRGKNWELLCSILHDTPGISPVKTPSKAIRGGYLEFKFILDHGIDRDEWVEAIRAEGVKASVDRYGGLHEANLFRHSLPLSLSCIVDEPDREIEMLPNMESVRNSIVTIPAYVDVQEQFVRQSGEAMKKVSACFAQR